MTAGFPILSAGPTPQIAVADWTLALQHGDRLLGRWSWNEFEALPQTTVKADIHCVTTWSKLDTRWQGVTFDDLLNAVGLAEPPEPYVMVHCDGGYTTNVPAADLVGGKGMIATRLTACLSLRRMEVPLACSCRTFISGKAENGCGGSGSCPWTSVVSGSRAAITITAIPGKNSDMTATDAAASRRRLEWQLAEVRDVLTETYRVKSLLLHLAQPLGHLPGQHVDVRLTADDGYQAQRSYSISSAPENKRLSLTVERVADGEVSPYLVDELRIGDKLQLRGPIGGHFVWTSDANHPLCLIAGGAGVTPLMAMLRHRDKALRRVPALLIYSARCLEDVIYREELDAMAARDGSLSIVYALTREQPEGWHGHRGRIDKALLAATCFPASQHPAIYVCGPSSFVESVSGSLLELGFDARRIKTERFGPSGG